ncbi:lanthionine synthetase LanC family protein [Chitinophaga niabensis]|uniref:Serine/threonine protein kinase n=1 Tax=Chitinophaga niabensis TaxID=536979 RepID=A0A1N6JBE5_9BACT|nr:lanthionine synthetase LanC family protein [Chitinophaga niabensis]SIO41658.1 Serine/threonine protein kinase [Chitinophaga niabensis]
MTEENIVNIEIDQTEQPINKLSKAEKKSGKRIGYNYIILKSFKESKKNDVVKCLYIKSLFDFGICVIKEGTYGDAKDIHGRDIKDRLIWQKELHQILQDKVRIPKFLGSFEENGNYYLAIERIKGESLGEYFKKHKGTIRDSIINGTKKGMKILNLLIQIAAILEKIHELRFIHRDVTTNNFIITPGNKIAIIDMELTYSLDRQFPSPPFMLGTRGFMSPEQEAANIYPSTKEDIYSFGMIMLHAWCDINPLKLNNTEGKDVERKVSFLIPDQKIAKIITDCLQPISSNRPTAKGIQETLIEYRKDLKSRKSRKLSTKSYYSNEEILETLQKSIFSLESPLFFTEEKGWFSESMRQDPTPKLDNDKITKAWYASFSKGIAGILYYLSIAKKAGLDISPTQKATTVGMQLIINKYSDRLNNSNPGLHFGSDGIASTLSFALNTGLIEWQPNYDTWIAQLLERRLENYGIATGIAGQGIANLHCKDYNPKATIIRLEQIVGNILERQEIKLGGDKEKNQSLGFLHGDAGVIFFLLEFGRTYQHKGTLQVVERKLEELMKKVRNSEKGKYLQNAKAQKTGHGWGEGLAGIAFTFLRAYDLFQHPAYKEFSKEILFNIPEKILIGSLSQYAGLSGIAEVYIEASRILKEEEWKKRTDHIAQLIMNLKKVHPKYGPYWLVEKERQPVGNFMIGTSGILHFLTRYVNPDLIHFPLFPEKYSFTS